MSDKPRALIFASLPPPAGGVASIVAMLHQSLGQRQDLLFASPLPKGKGAWNGMRRGISNLWKLLWAIQSVAPGGRLLFFSSAGYSFYEKLFWAGLALLFGRKSAIAMVDGNFPHFWHTRPHWLRQFVGWWLRVAAVRLGAQSPGWAEYYRRVFPGGDVQVFAATVAQRFLSQASPCVSQKALVLYVGWVIPEKGLLDLLDALVQVRKSVPDAKLRLVGPLFGREVFWQDQVKLRGLGDAVDMVGPVYDQNRLIHEMCEASVFVLPSHAEGMPVALLEAMALGVPCLGSNVGGIPDLLALGEAGKIVEPHAPAQLANALVEFLTDAQLRERLGRAAFERVRMHYSAEAFAHSYLQLLDIA